MPLRRNLGMSLVNEPGDFSVEQHGSLWARHRSVRQATFTVFLSLNSLCAACVMLFLIGVGEWLLSGIAAVVFYGLARWAASPAIFHE